MPEATDTPDQRRARRSREVRSRYPGGATDTPAGAYVTAARPPTPAERAEVGALLNSPAMRRRLRRDRSQLVRMPIDPTPEAAAARLARLALRQAGYWATPPRPRRAASPLQRGRRGSSRRQRQGQGTRSRHRDPPRPRSGHSIRAQALAHPLKCPRSKGACTASCRVCSPSRRGNCARASSIVAAVARGYEDVSPSTDQGAEPLPATLPASTNLARLGGLSRGSHADATRAASGS